MGKLIDMTGVVNNNWIVIEETTPKTKNKSNSKWWNCKCLKCGRIKAFCGSEIRLNRIGECKCDKQKNNKKDEVKKKEKKEKKICKNQDIPIKKKINGTSIIDETGNIYGKLTVISFSHTEKGFAYWNCYCQCGNSIVVRGNSLRTGSVKSCGCVNSWKEQEITQILIKNNIIFKREYTFEDLKDKGLLRFDFAVFKNNVVGLIEYQGEQHFEDANEFNDYGVLQYHDDMKINYCNNKKISLLILSKNDVLEEKILFWYNNL